MNQRSAFLIYDKDVGSILCNWIDSSGSANCVTCLISNGKTTSGGFPLTRRGRWNCKTENLNKDDNDEKCTYCCHNCGLCDGGWR